MKADGSSGAPQTGRVDAGASASFEPGDASLIAESLGALAGRENEIVEYFYPLFFERHPDVRGLFGEHSVNEREEMVRETLVSVLAHADDEPWLDGNLDAMGRSHAEYGVEGPSYPDYVVAMLDTLDHLRLDGWSPQVRDAWARALTRITSVMRRAGDEVDVG